MASMTVSTRVWSLMPDSVTYTAPVPIPIGNYSEVSGTGDFSITSGKPTACQLQPCMRRAIRLTFPELAYSREDAEVGIMLLVNQVVVVFPLSKSRAGRALKECRY